MLIKLEIFTISLTAWTLCEKLTIIGFDKLWWWNIHDFCLWVEGDFIFCALSSSDSYYCLWMLLMVNCLYLMILMAMVILIMMTMNVMISVKTVAWTIILHLTTTAMEIMMTMSHALTFIQKFLNFFWQLLNLSLILTYLLIMNHLYLLNCSFLYLILFIKSNVLMQLFNLSQ